MCFDTEGVKPAEEYLKQAVRALAGGDFSHPLFRFVQAIVKQEVYISLRSAAEGIWAELDLGEGDEGVSRKPKDPRHPKDGSGSGESIYKPLNPDPIIPQAIMEALLAGHVSLDEVTATYSK